jgi:hypothetical protein
MTLRMAVACDGTPAERPDMALGRCRAFIPTVDVRGSWALMEARKAGWTLKPTGGDLCPACSRALAAQRQAVG